MRQTTAGSRLGEARRALGLSVSEFGTLTGVPESSLKKYESGHSKPGLDAIQSIAKAGINTHWLVTGEGPMLLKEGEGAAHERQLGPVDRQRLLDVVETIEEALQARGTHLKPDKKAELIVLVYEEIAESEEAGIKYDKEKVVRLVNLAS